MAPRPPIAQAARRSRGGPRRSPPPTFRWGPRDGPQTPNRSGRAGAAVAALDVALHQLSLGAPRWSPASVIGGAAPPALHGPPLSLDVQPALPDAGGGPRPHPGAWPHPRPAYQAAHLVACVVGVAGLVRGRLACDPPAPGRVG